MWLRIGTGLAVIAILACLFPKFTGWGPANWQFWIMVILAGVTGMFISWFAEKE